MDGGGIRERPRKEGTTVGLEGLGITSFETAFVFVFASGALFLVPEILVGGALPLGLRGWPGCFDIKAGAATADLSVVFTGTTRLLAATVGGVTLEAGGGPEAFG
jgi:hypothetical protein